MRITIYGTRYNLFREVEIVKERAINYSDSVSKMDSPERVVELMQQIFDIGNLCEEHVYLVVLDAGRRTRGIFDVSHGILNSSLVHPREIFTRALLCGSANSIIILHNHPSGMLDISEDDRAVSSRIRQAGEILGIHLDDHLIIAGDSFVTAM